MVFTPKDVETLKTEALEDLGLEAYEGNEEVVDRVVNRLKAAEDLKKSLHDDKMSNREKLKEARKLAGLDPETGEKLQKVVETEVKTELSKKDQILEARALNSLHEDDIDEVVAIAEAKKVSLSEAVKSPYVKAFLKTREEERKTAEATSVGTTKKQSSKADGEALVKRALENKLAPEEMQNAAKALIDDVFGKK